MNRVYNLEWKWHIEQGKNPSTNRRAVKLIERTFELRGPEGLGAKPRPELIGPVLGRVRETLLDAVRMGFLHSSHARGRIPGVPHTAAVAATVQVR